MDTGTAKGCGWSGMALLERCSGLGEAGLGGCRLRSAKCQQIPGRSSWIPLCSWPADEQTRERQWNRRKPNAEGTRMLGGPEEIRARPGTDDALSPDPICLSQRQPVMALYFCDGSKSDATLCIPWASTDFRWRLRPRQPLQPLQSLQPLQANVVVSAPVKFPCAAAGRLQCSLCSCISTTFSRCIGFLVQRPDGPASTEEGGEHRACQGRAAEKTSDSEFLLVCLCVPPGAWAWTSTLLGRHPGSPAKPTPLGGTWQEGCWVQQGRRERKTGEETACDRWFHPLQSAVPWLPVPGRALGALASLGAVPPPCTWEPHAARRGRLVGCVPDDETNMACGVRWHGFSVFSEPVGKRGRAMPAGLQRYCVQRVVERPR